MPQDHPDPTPTPPSPPSLMEALRFWLKLGFISFGGPAGQLAIMHRELVEQRRWIGEARYLHALNFCMVLPGPEAQQMATYLGWLMHGVRGGLLAGALFVLPSLLILMLLGWLYMAFGHLAVVAGLFAGLKPAVAALVLQAVHRLGRRALLRPWHGLVAAGAFLAMTLGQMPFPWIVLAAALLGWWMAGRPNALEAGTAAAQDVAHAPPSASAAWIDVGSPLPPHAQASARRLFTVLAWGLGLWGVSLGGLVLSWGWEATLTQMGWFFTKAALLTFGGAYAVLPYVMQGAVEHYHWVSTAQMMDGLALGETTPGPLIMVVVFVAFIAGWSQALAGPDALLAGGALAAVLVCWFTFLPSFVFIFAGAPYIESTRRLARLSGPLSAISAAVLGVMLKLALFFCLHALWPEAGGKGWPSDGVAGLWQGLDLWAVLIATLCALALMRWQLGVLPVLAGAAAMGALGLWMRGGFG